MLEKERVREEALGIMGVEGIPTLTEAEVLVEAREKYPTAEKVEVERIGVGEYQVTTYPKKPKVIEMTIGGLSERIVVTEKEALSISPPSLLSTLPTKGKVTESILIGDIKGVEVPILKPMITWGYRDGVKAWLDVKAIEVGIQKETREAWEKSPARGPVAVVMHLPEIITSVGPKVIAAGIGTELRHWGGKLGFEGIRPIEPWEKHGFEAMRGIGEPYFEKIKAEKDWIGPTIQWGMFLAAPFVMKGVPSKLKIPTGFPTWPVKKAVGTGLLGTGFAFGVTPHIEKAMEGDVFAQIEVTKGITTMVYGAMMLKPTARTVAKYGALWKEKGMGLVELYPKKTTPYWKGRIYYGVGKGMESLARPFIPEPKVTWEVPSLKGYEEIETVTTYPKKPGYGKWREIKITYDPHRPTVEEWTPTYHRKIGLYPEYYSYREVPTLTDVSWKSYTTIGFRATRLGRPGISLESIPTVEDISKAIVSDKHFESLIRHYPGRMLRVTSTGTGYLGTGRYPAVLTEEGWHLVGSLKGVEPKLGQATPGTTYMRWGTYRFVKGPRPWKPELIKPTSKEMLESWKLSKRLVEAGKPEGALESKIFKFELGLEDIPVVEKFTITMPPPTGVEVKGLAMPIFKGTEPGFVRTEIITGGLIPAMDVKGLPTSKLIVGPSIKPLAKTKPIIEPSIKPIIGPTIKPMIRPIVEPSIMPIMRPSIKPIIMPITQPVMKPIMKPIIRPVIKPKVRPKIMPMPMPQPLPRPTTPSPFMMYLKPSKGIGIKKRGKRRVRRKYAYKPSVYGEFFIRPIKKAPKGIGMGLEPRAPIIGRTANVLGFSRMLGGKRKRRRKKKR